MYWLILFASVLYSTSNRSKQWPFNNDDEDDGSVRFPFDPSFYMANGFDQKVMSLIPLVTNEISDSLPSIAVVGSQLAGDFETFLLRKWKGCSSNSRGKKKDFLKILNLQKMDKAKLPLVEITSVINKLAKQVGNLEREIYGGRKVDENLMEL
ncbi:hypothetical protein L1987_75418 [Smallanthus sonchifolius]|uniref:Uncharacterized protein n=1 Tax=Smallanthus sonchifolius TaxID=185202 RepID=A0ACB9A5D5_9ASTR|nr:hypothetical protein L1987_75418 [Smallanthus sonchifolius]